MTSLSWVSENGLRFHIETSQSAAENGKMWRALCGAQGDCNFIHTSRAVTPTLRCATCQELSTTGISDVAPQQEHTTKAVTYADGTGEVRLKTGDGCTRKPSINPNSDTHLTSQNSNTYRGVAVSPAAPQVLDVAGQGRGTTPFTESITVGDKGGEVLSAQADLKTSSGDVRHAPPDKSTWQAKLYSGEMLNGFERAVMNAEINAGIVRSSSDSENGDELDAAMAQGWDERTL